MNDIRDYAGGSNSEEGRRQARLRVQEFGYQLGHTQPKPARSWFALICRRLGWSKPCAD